MQNHRKLRVFLCHASQDKPMVRDLYQRLAAEPWIDPWLDDCELPRRLRDRQTLDYFPESRRAAAYEKLKASLSLRKYGLGI